MELCLGRLSNDEISMRSVSRSLPWMAAYDRPLTQRPKERVSPFDGVRALVTIVLLHPFCIAALFLDRAANTAWRAEPFARIYMIWSLGA